MCRSHTPRDNRVDRRPGGHGQEADAPESTSHPSSSCGSIGAEMFRQIRGVRLSLCGYQRGTVPEELLKHGLIIIRSCPPGSPAHRRSHEGSPTSLGVPIAHVRNGEPLVAGGRSTALCQACPPSPRWYPQRAKRTSRTPPAHDACATTVMHPLHVAGCAGPWYPVGYAIQAIQRQATGHRRLRQDRPGRQGGPCRTGSRRKTELAGARRPLARDGDHRGPPLRRHARRREPARPDSLREPAHARADGPLHRND